MTSRIESLLKGEPVDFTHIEDELGWESIKFIERVGYEMGFDLTPNNNSDASGTFFIGSGGFSYKSFTEEWRENNTFLLEVSQPLIEIDGNDLFFRTGIEIDMKGEETGNVGFYFHW